MPSSPSLTCARLVVGVLATAAGAVGCDLLCHDDETVPHTAVTADVMYTATPEAQRWVEGYDAFDAGAGPRAIHVVRDFAFTDCFDVNFAADAASTPHGCLGGYFDQGPRFEFRVPLRSGAVSLTSVGAVLCEDHCKDPAPAACTVASACYAARGTLSVDVVAPPCGAGACGRFHGTLTVEGLDGAGTAGPALVGRITAGYAEDRENTGCHGSYINP
jgi:hypothetical protein